ncbi:MAG: response regulator [Elusimicrobia bacterium]|nr:response regulator [Elusimicrobiota bacterium]
MASRGLKVDTASDGLRALDKLKKHSYDAIILDMSMPGMDGIETLRRMLEINPDLRVILLTGHASVKKSVEAVKLGAVDFLEKPADINTLMEKIKAAKAEKMILVQKRTEQKLKDILDSKGW